jgi:hypothetical protein
MAKQLLSMINGDCAKSPHEFARLRNAPIVRAARTSTGGRCESSFVALEKF